MSGGRRRYGGSMFNLGLEYSDLKEIKLQSELNRTMIVPLNGPLNKHEIDTVNDVLNVQEIIKESLFYTGSTLSDANSKKNSDTSTTGGIYNDGIKRYSDRYVKKKNPEDEQRNLTDYPFNADFMPNELQSVIKGASGKRFMLSKLSNGNGKRRYLGKTDDDENNTENLTEEELTKRALERLRNIADIEEDNGSGVSGVNGASTNANVDEEIDDEDDEFDEDDDDDYNAEKYFDDGDDFEGDDFGGDNDEAAF